MTKYWWLKGSLYVLNEIFDGMDKSFLQKYPSISNSLKTKMTEIKDFLKCKVLALS